MLKIKRTFHLSIPTFGLASTRSLQLSPVPDDGDELTQAVAADTVDHDDNWVLGERPDEAELDAFWDTVEKDIQKDPSWFKFDD